ncbi:vitamin K epoxide reductase family protein [Prevotella pallens]|uniref:vitamin K epoxide reductase family protein n=1 Tax=Prevotella pallens TaxID=60133 RepID=UPI0028DB084A|nr:vitamin K epoxide reductase family protein [Prevotella pallens]
MRNGYIIDVVDKILFLNDIHTNRKELFKVLFSSPVFPSLAAISQTLSYYGLHNNAFVADLKHLLKLKNVIVHSIEKEEGHFYILTQIDCNTVTLYDGDETKISLEEFTVIWDGVVLIVEEKENVNIKRSIIAFPLCCLGFWGFLLLYFFFTTTKFTIDFILDSIGLTLSVVLLRQHLRIFEKTSFCQIGKNVDCNYVADRNPLQRWLPIDLAIVGVFFFLFNLLSLLIVGATSCISGYITLVAAIFMMFLSIYQVFKIKKYCLYCLGITIIIFAKLCISVLSFNVNYIYLLPKFVIATIIAYLFSYLIYKIMDYDKLLSNNDIELLRIKRNPSTIKNYFVQSHSIVSTEEMMEFGNKYADIEITTFISLHCRHCQKVVSEVIQLIDKFPKRFLWRVAIQGISSNDMDDNVFARLNTRQLHIFQLYISDKKRCLKAMRLWNFKNITDGSEELIAKYRFQQKNIEKMRIMHYPTIWVNGIVLPQEYSISDLQYINQELIEMKHNEIIK